MADTLLDLVLSELVDIDQILPWLAAPNQEQLSRGVLIQLQKQEHTEGDSAPLPCVTQPAFQAALLALVREEAEGLFLSLDASSEAATPRTSELALSPGSTPQGKLAGLDLPRSPVALDEVQFPPLNASQSQKGKADKVPPAAFMRMVNASRPPETPRAQTSQAANAGSRSHRIAPTKMQSVERRPQFAAVVEDRGSVKKQPRASTRIAPIKMEVTERTGQSQKGRTEQPSPAASSIGQQHSQHGRLLERPPEMNSHKPDYSTPTKTSSLEARLAGVTLNDSPASSQGSTRDPPNLQEVSSLMSGHSGFAVSGQNITANSRSQDDFIDEKYGKMPGPSPKKGKKGKSKSQQSNARRTISLGRPPRTNLSDVSCRNNLFENSGAKSCRTDSSNNRLSGNRTVGSVTPQSRFRPQASPSEQSTDPPHSSNCWPRLNSKPPTDSPESLSFSHLQMSSAIESGSPKTPTLARRIPGLSQEAIHPGHSPAGTTYFTASEAGSPQAGEDEHEADAASILGSNVHSYRAAAKKELSKSLLGLSPDNQQLHRTDPGPFNCDFPGPPSTPVSHSSAVEFPKKENTHQPSVQDLSPRTSRTASAAEVVGTPASSQKSQADPRLEDGQKPEEETRVQQKSQAGGEAMGLGDSDRAHGAWEEGNRTNKESVGHAQKIDLDGLQKLNIVDSTANASPTAVVSPIQELSPCMLKVSIMHATLMKCSTSIELTAELELLIHLLMLPERLSNSNRAQALKPCRLETGKHAVQYSLTVLSHTGNLLHGLSVDLLESIVEIAGGFAAADSTVQGSFVMSTLQAALKFAVESQTQLRQPKFTPGATNAFSLLAFTSDGLSKRTVEEQRKVSNRELCRDDLLALLREVSQSKQSLTSKAPSVLSSDEYMFNLIPNRATALVRKVLPENMGHFADLLLAAVLQTAATGEVLLDEELGKLAKQNLPKLQRLNQRMQAPGMSTQSSLHAGGSLGSGPTSQGRPFGAKVPQRGRTGLPKGSPEHPSKAIASNCPPTLRVYILILEAADSHRLNSCLERRVARRIQEVLHELIEGRSGVSGENHANPIQALALLLSYLQYASPGNDTQKGTPPVAVASSPVRDLIQATGTVQSGAVLLMTVYLATQYLWFLPWDPGNLELPDFKHLISNLACIWQSRVLRPCQAAFSQWQLCVLSLLETLWQRLGGCPLPQHPANVVPPAEAALVTSPESLGLQSQGLAEWFGPHMMQLCCPSVEHAKSALKAYIRGSRRNVRSLRQRKITPSVPVMHTAQVDIPQAVTQAAHGVKDADTLKLQSAFLDMYSTPDHQVKLREVVNQTSAVVSQNAASYVMDLLLMGLVTQSLDRKAAAEEIARIAHLKEGHLGTEAWLALLKPFVERSIASITPKILTGCLEKGEQYAKANVVKAISALSHHTWPEAVQGTAAAICLQASLALFASQIILEVPEKVRALVTTHINDSLRPALRLQKENEPLTQ